MSFNRQYKPTPQPNTQNCLEYHFVRFNNAKTNSDIRFKQKYGNGPKFILSLDEINHIQMKHIDKYNYMFFLNTQTVNQRS